jgi:hypothetical protein
VRITVGRLVVTVTDVGPLLIENVRFPGSVDQRRPDELSVLDTTELRWFASGPIPPDVKAWFGGSTGVCEQRCDTYLLEGRDDVGVKRRSRELLEVKVRQSLDERTQLGEGLEGQLEVWRKWSPVAGLVDEGLDGQWVDVCKSIVKRRFNIDGIEITFSPSVKVTGAGCDIEVAEVTVGVVQAWTFAIEAFGPLATRRDTLLASWRGLLAAEQCPKSWGVRNSRAMGYPEWLSLTVSSARRDWCRSRYVGVESPGAVDRR